MYLSPNFLTVKNFRTLVVLLGLILSFSSGAQSLSIQGLGGYQFFGSTYSSAGKLVLAPEWCSGVAIDFGLNRNVGFNLMYIYQGTYLRLDRSASFYEERLFDMNVHYIMAGTSYHVPNTSKFTPFGGVLFGLSIMEPVTRQYRSETFFALGGQGGVRLSFSERIGISGRFQLLAPIQGLGLGLFCGTGGCGGGVSASSSIVQMNTLLGVDVKLN